MREEQSTERERERERVGEKKSCWQAWVEAENKVGGLAIPDMVNYNAVLKSVTF